MRRSSHRDRSFGTFVGGDRAAIGLEADGVAQSDDAPARVEPVRAQMHDGARIGIARVTAEFDAGERRNDIDRNACTQPVCNDVHDSGRRTDAHRIAAGEVRVTECVTGRIDDRSPNAERRVRDGDDRRGPHDQLRRRPDGSVAIDEKPVGDAAFFPVARYAVHARIAFAERASDEFRRSARIERHRVRRSETRCERRKLRSRNADRERGRTTVDLEKQQIAVGAQQRAGNRKAPSAFFRGGGARIFDARPVRNEQRAAADGARDLVERRRRNRIDRDRVADGRQRAEHQRCWTETQFVTGDRMGLRRRHRRDAIRARDTRADVCDIDGDDFG